jgi:hypothetical protein
MAKFRPNGRVRQLTTVARAPREVPDCNRPLMRDRGASPGGLPPRGIPPGWKTIGGRSYELHTHS